ncbi:hypothetical protein Poly21_26560 [Allorhodopirellula heiligendammensis]|uniref:Uncharacterized protein n=1 Tax=Allorhodopirellula heiligendammensis TaxID=2714739 RepID=A0A5C6BTC6_9BACT|nr:hypothetical protein Poly21_26560 [Allorhodopirellula heiligendammensis]
MKFALVCFLLIIAIVGGTLAVRYATQCRPDVYYLHLYSNRYVAHVMRTDYPPSDYDCLATFSICPEVPFYAALPNYYKPEIEVSGTITLSGDSRDSSVVFRVGSPDESFEYNHDSFVQPNRLFSFQDDSYRCVVSTSKNPFSELIH